MIEIRDQFAQNPCLVGIAHAAMLVLDASLGHDLPPGQVRSATFFSFLGSIGIGLSIGDAVIWFEMVRTASKPLTRASSR